MVSSVDQGLRSNLFGLSSSKFMERIPRSTDFALFKRDVCADAIPGTVTRTCTPGNTLCCVPSDSNVTFPQCQQILGEGFVVSGAMTATLIQFLIAPSLTPFRVNSLHQVQHKHAVHHLPSVLATSISPLEMLDATLSRAVKRRK